ncbi:hypothetical protein RRG08_012047 [Elysia crispata]|uniref:Uncharacterized protein n=1 Tax=Elysia crispata TaxID=231223 RepID=A0AAE0XWA7_9GAST|nr:hypothetical protein RRG08_012047 [Elysia crispata]
MYQLPELVFGSIGNLCGSAQSTGHTGSRTRTGQGVKLMSSGVVLSVKARVTRQQIMRAQHQLENDGREISST